MYIQEAGEGTSPILSFLHPFVMIWNKKLSAESYTWYNTKQQERHRIALTYLNFCHYDHCVINTIVLATHNILNWHYTLMFYLCINLILN